MARRLGIGAMAATQLVHLDDAMADWRKAVLGAQPAANADFVRATGEEIVRRARVLSVYSKLNFPEVCAFLLMRSRAWVLGGLQVNQITTKLPKTLEELGMMKLAEGGAAGGPLDPTDIKNAMARPQHRIIQ